MEARVGHLQVIHSYKHCKNMENKIVYKQLSLSGSYVTKPSCYGKWRDLWSPKIIDKQVVNSQQSHKSVNKKIEK